MAHQDLQGLHDLHDLTGRLALVAGGSDGIGLASARALVQRGAQVVIAARRPDQLERARQSLQRDAPTEASVGVVELDALDPDAVDRACDHVLAEHGAPGILVNSVGAAPSGTFGTLSRANWNTAIETKVLGAVQLMKRLTPGMTAAGWGRVINIAGTAGREPDPWMVLAGVANASLMVVTKTAATELAPQGVTVNAVLPGPVATQRWQGLVAAHAERNGLTREAAERELCSRIPTGRPADPADVGELVAFLATTAARHITGAAIPVDGGQSAAV